jgi:DNA-binding MarR family transcriptional regulator
MIEKSATIVLSLQRATHRVLQVLDDAAKELGLSPVEMNVLANLRLTENATVSQVGRATGLRPSTATGVLDRLEDRGLLGRLPNPADRRSTTIELSNEGQTMARKVMAAMRAVDDQIRASTPDSSLMGYHEVVGAISALSPTAEPGGGSDAR